MYSSWVRAEYREEPCKSALNRVAGMPFPWSLNPYMGCVHRCTFCYVRAFERRADRPAGEEYGRTIRVKVNVVFVLRRELARSGWRRELVAIGAATDPYQPAEGRYRLTRGCLEALAGAHTPFNLITRGPLIVRDIDVLRRRRRSADVDVCFSLPTLDESVWRRTEPGTAPPRQRLRAVRALAEAGIRTRWVWRRSCPESPIAPSSWPPLSGRPGRRERVISGETSSIFAPARVSTSSTIWRATGPRSSSVTAALRPGPLHGPAGRRADPESGGSTACRALGWPSGASRPPAPRRPPEPEQLELVSSPRYRRAPPDRGGPCASRQAGRTAAVEILSRAQAGSPERLRPGTRREGASDVRKARRDVLP